MLNIFGDSQGMMMKKTLKFLLGVLCCCILISSVQAAETVSAAKILEAEKRADKKVFPDSHTVLLYNLENIRYEENGLSVSTDEYYQKVLTEKGRKELRSFTFHFNSTYENIEIEKTVIFRKGKQIVIDPRANSKVSIEPGQMGSNIYDPANKIMTLAVPGLEIGDVVGLKVKRVVKKARIPGFWGNYIPLQGDMPILKYEVRVDAPEKLPLRSIAVKDKAGKGVQFSSRKNGNRILYTWVAENVPQAIPEPDMPPLYTAVQRLLIGTAESWSDISKWYYRLCRPHLDKIDDAIRAQVAELTRSCKTSDEKIMAIFQFVSQKIRYMGLTPESEAPGYEPHDVTMTFHRRYGVCRDKAALLAAMLEAAGLKAYPVLIMAGVPKDDDVPNGYFNHAITCVESAPGKYILMDPTNESARELLPATLANCSYLVAKPEGDKLRRTPSPDSKFNRVTIRSFSRLAGDGRLTGNISLDFTGVNDQIYRDAFSRWTPEEADQYFSRQISSVVPGAELTGLEIKPVPVRDMSKPLCVKLKYTADGLLPDRNGPAVLQLSELGDSIGASGFLLGSFALKKRQFKLQIPSTFSVVENYQLELPSHLKLLSLPKSEKLGANGLIRWERKIKQKGAVLSGHRFFSVDSLEFTPSEYSKVRDVLRKMDMKRKALPIVENDFSRVRNADTARVFAGADLLVLLDKVRYTVLDKNNWQEDIERKYRVLTYAGMKDASELQIPYNPVWDQLQVSGSVTSPSGKVRHLQDQEINLMDAPWNASAPRYPGGKILVANFPGVEIGSEIYLKIHCRRRRPVFAEIMTFAGFSPVAEIHREVDIPDRLVLRTSPLPQGVEFKEKRVGDRRILTWNAKNVHRVHSERSQAPLWCFVPSVMFSAGQWKNISGSIKDVFEQLSQPGSNPEAAHLAAKLTTGLSNDGSEQERIMRRVKAIRDYVAKYIRRAGPGLNELPLDKLSLADVTLKSGYGNSADLAILLGAMLRSVGLEPEFYPVSDILYTYWSIRGLERFPQRIFNNVLVYVPQVEAYLNDTSQYAQPGAVNSADKVALSLKNRRMDSIRSSLKHESRIERLVEVDIQEDGSANMVISDRCYGAYFESANRLYSEQTPELRKRHFAELASRISRAAEITGTPVTDFRSYPGEVRYSLHCPGFTSSAGEYLEFDLPFFKTFSAAAGVVKKNRKTPFRRNDMFLTSIRYKVVFPNRYTVSTGRPAHLRLGDHNIGSFSQDCVAGDGMLDIICKGKIPAGIIPAVDCDKLFTLRHQLARPNAGRIVLIPKGAVKK